MSDTPAVPAADAAPPPADAAPPQDSSAAPPADAGAPPAGGEKKWVYLDDSGAQQGPFSTTEMNSWFTGGFLAGDRKVKEEGSSADFADLSSIPELSAAAVRASRLGSALRSPLPAVVLRLPPVPTPASALTRTPHVWCVSCSPRRRRSSRCSTRTRT